MLRELIQRVVVVAGLLDLRRGRGSWRRLQQGFAFVHLAYDAQSGVAPKGPLSLPMPAPTTPLRGSEIRLRPIEHPSPHILSPQDAFQTRRRSSDGVDDADAGPWPK